MPDPTAGGQLIVAMGIPCCGKSSVFDELGHIHNLEVFHEPEEEKWPEAVHSRDVCGRFTAITWFRCARVPSLFAAEQQKRNGKSVLVDSYYDKLCSYYVGKPGMEWLIGPDDPYFELTRRMTSLDREHLPDADVVVYFELEPDVWEKFRNCRGRALDKDREFADSFRTQEYFKNASAGYCNETGAKFVLYRQSMSNPQTAARELSGVLQGRSIQLTSTDK